MSSEDKWIEVKWIDSQTGLVVSRPSTVSCVRNRQTFVSVRRFFALMLRAFSTSY